ncbi:Glutathione hydrolase 3 [Camellia lanceoleosa]|uniref:Glutathione hydrolase 3 n=1 Tax=Camellia lanceoleosa TaxID=1840588 RepID=A0ACC0IYD2_9ERIC|nr:Glutathione hydrolase 3 [Camellia lanceoleosa]
MTTTINYGFGAGFLSLSTGIVLNNEIGDFSTPTEISPDQLPHALANFIRPNKRPLSSMTPIIVLKVDEDYKRMVILTLFLQVYIFSGLSFLISNNFVFIIV